MNANMDALLRLKIPLPMQARVYAARNTLQFCTIPVGYLLGGWLVDGVCTPLMAAQGPASPLARLLGTGGGAGASAAVFDPRLRGRGRLPAFPPRPPHTRAGEVNDNAPSHGSGKGRLHRWTALFFHQSRPGVPCLAGLFAGYVVTMLELIEDEGVQLFGGLPCRFRRVRAPRRRC